MMRARLIKKAQVELMERKKHEATKAVTPRVTTITEWVREREQVRRDAPSARARLRLLFRQPRPVNG